MGRRKHRRNSRDGTDSSGTALKKPNWQRVPLIVSLTGVALAAGLYWNARRLNDTVRRIVGVWDSGGGVVYAYLPDRSYVVLHQRNGYWDVTPGVPKKWRADDDSLDLGFPHTRPRINTPAEWLRFARDLYEARNWYATAIVRITSDELVLEQKGAQFVRRRSRDPELMRVFQRLNE